MDSVGHVLVVDDRQSLQTAVQLTLEAEGYTVSVASDGAQALQVMEEAPPDIILADVMMPGMDGYDLYHAVRARSEWTSIPFVFLTARAQREEVIKGKALGVEEYLTKPVDPAELLVTVRARLTRARAIREDAEAKLDEIKQQIITMLGHEMRTPLTYIRGYTEMALRDIASLPPESLEELLRGVSQGADRLTKLANDFLMVIRLDTSQTEKEFEQLAELHQDLDAIVEHTLDQYGPQAVAAGLRLESLVESSLPPARVCEPLFSDALGRLVDNAIKFSQGVGQRVAVSAREAQGWIEIAVIDEGIGISAKELPCLFERFRQINREKMEQQGAGLGLFIAQGLIQLHGGEIAVASTPGEGSIFTIKLPVLDE
jgi:two-component system sensor histidine kinase/response regulator